MIRRRLGGDHTDRPFHYRDLGSLAAISRFRAVAKIGPVSVGGFVGWLLWLVVHLTFLTGFKNRLAALAHWGISFVGRDRTERTITFRQMVARGAIAALADRIADTASIERCTDAGAADEVDAPPADPAPAAGAPGVAPAEGSPLPTPGGP